MNNGSVPDEYVKRLCDEISEYKRDGKIALSTVYFGGGTPSLLSPKQMKTIVDSIRDTFDMSLCGEITLEANPGTVTVEKASKYKALGFNRISMGLQSIHEKEMKMLGRIHNFDEFSESYRIFRSVGFDNINVDLMYGIPHQTLDSFKETLECVTALSPEHISAYGLIVEDGTPFYLRRGELDLPSDDEECDMYDMCCSVLASHGYKHYEISNYAKEGYESRHNLIYWHMDPYIGVGASAHSYFEGRRFFNTSDIDSYICGDGCNISESASDESEFEYAMLGLRLSEGLSLSDYEHRFGHSFMLGKEEYIGKLISLGLARLSDGRFALTERGFYLSNTILSQIL